MPECSTPSEDVEELMRNSYESGPSSKDEHGREVRQLAVGTSVRLTEQGREWNKSFVPDSALTIVRSRVEGGVPVYDVRDEEGTEFSVRNTDVEVDTSRSVDPRTRKPRV